MSILRDVSLSKPQHINKLMKRLLQCQAYLDLEFVCTDGSVFCHKFIIGAHSNFLKNLMLQDEPRLEHVCQIHVPDFPKFVVEETIKFLYTGRLEITSHMKNQMQEFLVDIIRIDANLVLPESKEFKHLGTNSPPKVSNTASMCVGKDAFGNLVNLNSKTRKCYSSDSLDARQEVSPGIWMNSDPELVDLTEQGVSHLNKEAEPGLSFSQDFASVILDGYPSYGLKLASPDSDRSCDNLVSMNEEGSNLEINDFARSDTDSFTDSHRQEIGTDNETRHKENSPRTLVIPKILKSSSTRPCPKSKKNLFKCKPQSEQVLAEENESRVRYETVSFDSIESTKRKFEDSNESPKTMSEAGLDDVLDQSESNEPNNHESESWARKPINEKFLAKQNEGKRRRQTESFVDTPAQEIASNEMSTRSTLLDSNDLFTHETSADSVMTSTFDHTSFGSDEYRENQELYDKISVFVIDEGEASADEEMTSTFSQSWKDSADCDQNENEDSNSMFLMPSIPLKSKRGPKKDSFERIRKYSYSPITISGRQLKKTFEHMSEPDGYHECQDCTAVFSKRASLKTHTSRYHNTNLTSQCPECPKTLSNKNAIKKHLLSHRPKSEWPIECPLCGQKFQAKGDMPKHFFTSAHKGDPRVPARGSDMWFELIEQSVVDEAFATKNRKRATTCY